MSDMIKKLNRYPYATISLTAVNAIVFLVNLFAHGALFYIGELSVNQLIIDRDYYRILSAMFLHGDTGHLFNNMMILIFLGAMLEAEIGHLWLYAGYFLAGIGGNIASVAYRISQRDYYVASVGASGAVFGLDGILLALVLFHDRDSVALEPKRVLFMIGLSLYVGLANRNVDNAAHIGGLLVGFLVGIIICLVKKIKRNKKSIRRF